MPSESGGEMVFEGVTQGSTLSIYTLSGKLVKSVTGGGSLTWDAKNGWGGSVSQGMYLYVITDPLGNKTTGKVVIR